MSTPDDCADALAITLDLDWVADEAVDDAVARLRDAGVRATIFATHHSPVLEGLDPAEFEVGLHPSFEGDEDPRRILSDLKEAFPGAQGARSHALHVSSRILQQYIAHGLTYEANVFLPGHEQLHPVARFAGLVSIPFIWSDDKHLELGRPHDVAELPIDRPGLKVLNFHPIHTFLNTADPEHYVACRPFTTEAGRLREARNSGGRGIGTLFDDLLATIAQQRMQTCLLREVRDAYLASI